MKSMKYAELLGRLDAALAYCDKLGLGGPVKGSRFTTYQERIKRLSSLIESCPFDNLPPEVKKELTDRNLEHLISLTDSMELVETMDYLRACDDATAKDKLAKILKGPVLPKNEDKNSNEARNTLFEVNLASKFWAAGLKPSLSKLADIELEIAGKLLVIECKRPIRESRMKKRIKAARKQIADWLKNMPEDSKGVIAISLTKILNPGDKVFAFRDVETAKATLSRLLEQLAARNKKTLDNLGKNVVGVLFHVITPSIDEKRYSLGEQFNAHPLAKPGSADESTFQALGDALIKLE